jgi:hypothetical protein
VGEKQLLRKHTLLTPRTTGLFLSLLHLLVGKSRIYVIAEPEKNFYLVEQSTAP